MPLAVTVLAIDDTPLTDVAVLRPGYVYDLGIDLRLEVWPDWADRCEVQLLSTLPPDALVLPAFRFTREALQTDANGARLVRSCVAVRCLIPLVTRGISDVRGVGFWLREGGWDHRLDELEGSTLGGGWAGQLLDVHSGRVGEDDVVAGESGQVGKQGVEAVGWGAVVELVL